MPEVGHRWLLCTLLWPGYRGTIRLADAAVRRPRPSVPDRLTGRNRGPPVIPAASHQTRRARTGQVEGSRAIGHADEPAGAFLVRFRPANAQHEALVAVFTILD